MKNILEEKPSLNSLNSRMSYTLDYIQKKDIKDKVVLDIGCGFGWCELYFLKKGVKKIIGIEIADEDLHAARENVKDKRAIFKVGSAIDIPLKSNSVDTIVCFEVIEHIPKGTEEQLFSEVKRVLKKGGAFYLSTPFDHPLTKFLDPAWWLIGHRHYSRSKLSNYGNQHGFKVESTAVKGGIWSILGLVHMYIAKWLLRSRKLSSYAFFEKKESEEYDSDNNRGIGNIFVRYRRE